MHKKTSVSNPNFNRKIRSVKLGFAEAVGTEKHRILDAMKRIVKHPKELPRKSPYEDGNAAEKLLK